MGAGFGWIARRSVANDLGGPTGAIFHIEIPYPARRNRGRSSRSRSAFSKLRARRSAAVGAVSGVGLVAEATVLTVAVLAGNTETVGEVRDLLAEVLEKASYPIRQIEVVERAPEASEIVATLVSNAVDPVELDAAASVLEQSPLVSYASWSASSNE
jgi:hypothetical protein